jgi:molybdopterin/thiamine biosynthesis adenylyltransferase
MLLRSLRVGIIGLGGAGSVLAELLGRLGVGEFVLVDPDTVERSNLPRLIGACEEDAGTARENCPKLERRPAAAAKIAVAARNIRRANPSAQVSAFQNSFLDSEVAMKFTDCDYLFLAADTMSARLLFNAIVHQYGIAGVQVGAKVPVDRQTGVVGDVFCVSRAVAPGEGCLLCNGLINPSKLQDELISPAAKAGFAYVDEPDLPAPSVVTLNAIACAHAADAFLFHVTGLKYPSAEVGWFRWNSRRNQATWDLPRKDPECPECSTSDASRFARGDGTPLPVRVAQ